MSRLRAIRTEESFLTREGVADLLKVSVPTVDRMRKDGMPCVRWGRRLVRFRPSEVTEWFENQGA